MPKYQVPDFCGQPGCTSTAVAELGGSRVGYRFLCRQHYQVALEGLQFLGRMEQTARRDRIAFDAMNPLVQYQREGR